MAPILSALASARSPALVAEDMKAALISRGQKLPLPFHPEPGGRVPWGRTADDDVLHTGAADPTDWTTVLTVPAASCWCARPTSRGDLALRPCLTVADVPRAKPTAGTKAAELGSRLWSSECYRRRSRHQASRYADFPG